MTRGQRFFYAILALALGAGMFVGLGAEYRKYHALATRGQATVATVLSYEPTHSHYTKGTTTYHYHILSFDGRIERVELPRPEPPGAQIPLVYLPDDPGVVALGQAGMSAAELMGGEIVWVVAFALCGSTQIVWGLWTLRRLARAGQE